MESLIILIFSAQYSIKNSLGEGLHSHNRILNIILERHHRRVLFLFTCSKKGSFFFFFFLTTPPPHSSEMFPRRWQSPPLPPPQPRTPIPSYTRSLSLKRKKKNKTKQNKTKQKKTFLSKMVRKGRGMLEHHVWNLSYKCGKRKLRFWVNVFMHARSTSPARAPRSGHTDAVRVSSPGF